ncbi:glycoside hydrolase family 5 protein [Streptomyces sp. NPDC057116]|uniref:glycoside hydrolase family 5 protein n=1 Tax=Streptomyces sp. NPDC057116 TaxID=3346023 RepID=UPI0036408F17
MNPRALSAAVLAVAALLAALLVSAPGGTTPAAAPAAPDGFRVSDSGRLVESDDSDFVMRGVNLGHAWYPGRTGASMADVKSLGANTVRVALGTGDRWTRSDPADVAAVVERCRANRLICVLDVHDTTGYGEESGAVPLSRAVDYWIGVRSALKGQERYVIINIANEPYGRTGASGWTTDTKAAVQKLRAAGFTHTLMVDAPDWGQDRTFTMRDNAASVLAADPERNTVFSVHMYGVFDTAAEVRAYLSHFVAARLPVVVGEFGHEHTDGDPDEEAVLATAEDLGVGYLGWSWSGNTDGVEYLDMAAGFDPAALTTWGRRIFHGANGIAATAKEASVYADAGPSVPDRSPAASRHLP